GDDRGDLAERAQRPLLAGGTIAQHARFRIDAQFITGTYLLAQPVRRLERDQVAAVDGIAEEDAGVELGDDGLDAGRGQGDRGVLARRPAAEIAPGDDDLVGRDELVARVVEWDVPLRQ